MPGFDVNRFVGLDQSLAQHLKCGVCLNIFDDAFDSVCGHTFCKTCVQGLIDSKTKSCPECRQNMKTRKRGDNQRDLVVNGYLFVRNIKINQIINDLRIKCHFESNGCQQTVPLGLLSDHLKSCEHWNCESCGFTVRRADQHNCIQLLKNDRNEWQRKYEEGEQLLRLLLGD